jgi:hypothetical protein
VYIKKLRKYGEKADVRFGRQEKLNSDPPFPYRLTHSILSEEGEGITKATFWKSPREGHPSF